MLNRLQAIVDEIHERVLIMYTHALALYKQDQFVYFSLPKFH